MFNAIEFERVRHHEDPAGTVFIAPAHVVRLEPVDGIQGQLTRVITTIGDQIVTAPPSEVLRRLRGGI